MNFKVFYKDKEVAEFKNQLACYLYIKRMLKVDKELKEGDFIIYQKVENKIIHTDIAM